MASITSTSPVGIVPSSGSIAVVREKIDADPSVSVSFNSDYMRIKSAVEPPRLDKVMKVYMAMTNGTADSTVFTEAALERSIDRAIEDIKNGK